MNDISLLLVLAVGVLLVIVAVLVVDRQRSAKLRSRFGAEYDHAVEEAGSRRTAETDLADRTKRVEELDIRPLDPADRQRYATQWRELQGRFVDDPKGAIRGADDLIGEVMEARGYPVADFNRRVDDISVDHGAVVEHYRVAHEIAQRSNGAAPADTEELRQALVHYRALFTSLLGDRPDDRLTDEPASDRQVTEATPTGDPAEAEPTDADTPVGSRRTS